MAFFNFQWDDESEAHLAEHGVSPEEFEEIVMHPDDKKESRSSGLPAAIGETPDGRVLFCVYELLSDGITVLPVTAYEIGNE